MEGCPSRCPGEFYVGRDTSVVATASGRGRALRRPHLYKAGRIDVAIEGERFADAAPAHDGEASCVDK